MPPAANNKRLLKQFSSYLEGHHESFMDEGSIVHSVVQQSPDLRKISYRPKHPEKATRPWISFIVVYTMIFFNGCCFTAVVPSVPFYLQQLSAPPSFLGWVVSFYSLGQIFGSPLGGWLADKVSSRTLLTTSSTVGLLSSILYSVAPAYMLVLVARLLTGISAGMEFSVELAFIAKGTTKKERTVFMASVTAVNVVGFIFGPALGGLLATLDLNIMGVKVDQYTGPGWLLAIMFVVDIFMAQFLFKDIEDGDVEDLNAIVKKETSSNNKAGEEQEGLLDNGSNMNGVNGKSGSYGGLDNDDGGCSGDIVKELEVSLNQEQPPPPSKPLVIFLIFVQFTFMSAWSILETITSPLASDHFGWDVPECNLLFTAGGLVSLVAYFMFITASKCTEDRVIVVVALIVCFVGQMMAIDWEQLDWVPDWISALFPSTYRNRFLLGYALMNGGFMTGRPVTFALFSKLIASEYQGRYLSWMVAGGSLARMLGPFAAVAVYYGITAVGINLLTLFGSVGIFHMSCLCLVICQWEHLLPKRSQWSIRKSMRAAAALNGDPEKGSAGRWEDKVQKEFKDDEQRSSPVVNRSTSLGS